MNKSHAMNVLHLTLAGAALFGIAAWSQPQTPTVTNATEVPIGGVILWWGKAIDIPFGFEACDGNVITTKDAVLRGAKPNMTNKFARGPVDYRTFVPQAFAGGGSDTATLNVQGGDHVLTQNELPAHAHPQSAHSHTIPTHRHAVNDHNHGMAHVHGIDHSHAIQDHDHLIGTFVPGSLAAGVTNFLSKVVPGVDHSAMKTGLTAPMTSGLTSAASSAANTAMATGVLTQTDGGGGATSVSTAATGNTGGGQANKHPTPNVRVDTLPAYTTLVYLIRVK
jgi:hypothetical protein